jgi:hypothetical protein
LHDIPDDIQGCQGRGNGLVQRIGVATEVAVASKESTASVEDVSLKRFGSATGLACFDLLRCSFRDGEYTYLPLCVRYNCFDLSARR